MTIKQLIEKLKTFDENLNVAIHDEGDDFLLMNENIDLGEPYFGNCYNGTEWENNNAPRDKNGDVDYDKMPKFLIIIKP